MTYRLILRGKVAGEMDTLQGCWAMIDSEIGRLPDEFTYMRWKVVNLQSGCVARANFDRNLWEASCETFNAFRLYVRISGVT